MAGYRHLDVSEVGDVTVVRFRDHKIIEDINIHELGQELFHLIEVETNELADPRFCANPTDRCGAIRRAWPTLALSPIGCLLAIRVEIVVSSAEEDQ